MQQSECVVYPSQHAWIPVSCMSESRKPTAGHYVRAMTSFTLLDDCFFCVHCLFFPVASLKTFLPSPPWASYVVMRNLLNVSVIPVRVQSFTAERVLLCTICSIPHVYLTADISVWVWSMWSCFWGILCKLSGTIHSAVWLSSISGTCIAIERGFPVDVDSSAKFTKTRNVI